jgi:hypothetical protein
MTMFIELRTLMTSGISESKGVLPLTVEVRSAGSRPSGGQPSAVGASPSMVRLLRLSISTDSMHTPVTWMVAPSLAALIAFWRLSNVPAGLSTVTTQGPEALSPQMDSLQAGLPVSGVFTQLPVAVSQRSIVHSSSSSQVGVLLSTFEH